MKNLDVKQLHITPPKGYVIDEKNSTFENIIFKKIDRIDTLPTKWEDVKYCGKIYSINNGAEVDEFERFHSINLFKNSLTTKRQAEEILTFMQLCFLRDIYNGEPLEDWVDWEDRTYKWAISYCNNTICKSVSICTSHPITFKTQELRDKFFDNFQDLLEKAKMYL